MAENQPIVSASRFPQGAVVIFFLMSLTMIGYVMVYSLIELYVTRRFHFSFYDANQLSASFNAMIFSLALFGGLLGERYLGYRYAILVGCVLGGFGFFVMMIPHILALYWGLAFVSVSLALLMPCSYVLLGRLYRPHDPWRDSGFTLMYIGTNVGGLFASVLAGPIAEHLGFRYAFLLAGIVMLITLWVFLVYRKTLITRRAKQYFDKMRPDAIRRNRKTGLFFVAFSLPVVTFLFKFAYVANILIMVLGVFAFGMVFYISKFETQQYRRRLRIFLVLCILALAFWTLYMLGPAALTLFIDRHVNRGWAGMTIPTEMYLALNPLFVVVVGLIFSWMWFRMRKRDYNVSIPFRIALGVLLMGLGYLVLVLGVQRGAVLGVISSYWIVLSFFLQTCGELLVGPIAIAMVGELVPARMEGLMMGVLQVVIGFGGAMSAFLSNYASPKYLHQNGYTELRSYSHAFAIYGVVAIVIALVAFLLLPKINKLLKLSLKPIRPD